MVSAAMFARMRATVPEGARSSWPFGRLGMTRQASGKKGNVPNFSQYSDSSHPEGRIRAVRGASKLALHRWAILGSNQ